MDGSTTHILPGDDLDSPSHQENLHYYLVEHKRWKKKTLQARCLIGLMTLICCILIVVLIVTYDSGRRKSRSTSESSKNEAAETTSDVNLIKFIHLSDIHYDPFYNKMISSSSYCRQQVSNSTAKYIAEYGRIGCDSPATLVENSLDAMKNVSQEEDIAFILMTGDFSAHGMWTSYAGPQRVLDNIATVSKQMHSRFPKIPIFPMIGNNDLPGHYVLPKAGDDWYQKVLSSWESLIMCSECPSSVKKPTTQAILQESFLEGGYYNASIADGKVVLLVLNSLYWSAAVNRSVETDQKASRQLVWLENQLKLVKSRGQKAMLASHIPAGIDTFSSKPYWFNNYTAIYVRLVAKNYSDVVIGQFFAHSHKDDFRLQMFEPETSITAKSFVLLAPAISPVYHNNPAFRLVSLDIDQQSLADYTQYYMDLVMATQFSNPVWQVDYTFSKKYPSDNTLINAERIYELNEQLINQTSDTFWNGYAFSRETNYQPMPYNRFTLYCGMRFVDFQNFQKCTQKYSVPGG